MSNTYINQSTIKAPSLQEKSKKNMPPPFSQQNPLSGTSKRSFRAKSKDLPKIHGTAIPQFFAFRFALF
jgi:hypothetical protein